MSLESIEEGSPCDYCGTPIEFLDENFALCPVCQNEFYNMDYVGESPGDPAFRSEWQAEEGDDLSLPG
jgi:hypothetical protein